MGNGQARRPMMEPIGQPAAIVVVLATLLACGTAVRAQGDPPAGPSESGAAVVRFAGEGPLHAAVRFEKTRLAQGSGQTAPSGGHWVVRHPVIVGTLIGTGAGAALSRTRALGGVNHDPKVALLGAGAGAWGGLIASAVHKARAGDRVGRGTKIGIVAGAAALAVLPLLACYGAGGCGGSS